MPIINKTKRTAAIYNRGREVVKVYDHGVLAWQKSTSIHDYLCFTALEAGQFTLTIPAAVTPTYLSYVEWSKDGRTWNHTDNTSEAVTIDVQVASGEKVYWRGSGKRMTMGSYVDGRASYFSSTCRFDASGNLMSLLTDDFANVTTWSPSYTFASLFKGCTTLISAKDMVLTLTTLPSSMFIMTFNGASSMVSALTMDITDAGDNCFNSAFQGCSALTDISGLKMTLGQLRTKVLYYTFRSCTGLVTPPPISFTSFATSSSENCLGMFYDCSSLESSFPLLPTTLVSKCYYAMFNNCRKLASVKCLATDLSATNCIYVWLANTSSTGVFIQAENVAYPRSSSGIPTEWVDIEKRTMPTGYKQVKYAANPNKPSATPMPIVETGIVLDPSQDTIEIAVFPHIGDDGYIAHHRYGGLPIANNMSPAQSGAKVGRFYCMYRKIDSANVIQFSWTKATSANSTLTATNKIVETPQVLRIELSSGNNKMLLNGTQVATNSDACDISDPGTETAKLFGINNVGYNWIDPIYYMKWWRNGVLIADYVACVRESDNEPSFYDFVSNTFKVPTRTGFFTAGEEI